MTTPPARRPWLVSPAFDLALVFGPLAFAFAAMAWVPLLGLDRPLWAYLLFIVSFDVAHVWATGYITYFDREALGRRRALLTALPVACFGASFALHALSPTLFWSALAYVAILHFVRQQVGFVSIYRARGAERDVAGRRLDKLAVYTGALGPVALWHADPAERFDWFDSGEVFALRLPEASMPVIELFMAAVAVAWIAREAQRWRAGHRNVPKVVWVVATWVAWFAGIRIADNFYVAAAFLNLFHGVPYVALIWLRVRRNPALLARGRSFVPWVARGGRWLVFYALLLGIALVEESFWERFVWLDYAPDLLGRAFEPAAGLALSFWIAALSLPQVTHYVLDGVLWRMRDPRNGDAVVALGLRA